MSDVISDYLKNGTVTVSPCPTDVLTIQVSPDPLPAQTWMPAQHRCFGNGVPDNRRKSKQETKVIPLPVASPKQAQWYPPISSCKWSNEVFPSGWSTSDGRPVLFYGMSGPSSRASTDVC